MPGALLALEADTAAAGALRKALRFPGALIAPDPCGWRVSAV